MYKVLTHSRNYSVAQLTTIEANSEVMLEVKVKAEDQTNLQVTRYYLNDGALIIPDSLTTVKDNQALIQILNISATKQTVSENSLLLHYDLMHQAVHSVSNINRVRDDACQACKINHNDVNCTMHIQREKIKKSCQQIQKYL